MNGVGMENGMKWFPRVGVVPVVNSKSVSRWVLSRTGGEEAKAAAMDLARRFALGRIAVASGGAERVEVWSEKAYLPLDDVLLLGDSSRAVHRWALTREMFAENHAEAPVWMEEDLDDAKWQDLFGFLGHPGLFGNGALPGGGGVVVPDLGRVVGLDELPRLDQVAKSCGAALLVGADLRDVRGEPVDVASYATIAMPLALERGIDLSRLAGTIAVVDELTDGGHGWRGRILRAEGDGVPIPVGWPSRTGREVRG